MTLIERINNDLKDAMRSKDAVKRTTLRSILNGFKEAEERKRDELTKKALKAHGVIRPNSTDEAELEAYSKAIDAAITAEKVDTLSGLDEAEQIAVIQKLVKQHIDSIQEAEKAGRVDVVESEKAELMALEVYLPAQMSREEIEVAARAVISQVGASGPKDTGKVMGPLVTQLKGKADGKLINEVVRDLLSG